MAKINNPPYSEEEKEYLRKYYSYLDRKTMVSEMNRTWKSMVNTAAKLGLNRPKIRQAKLKKLLPNNVDNAYWWGFIMADGYISNKGDLKISLSTSDEEHLIALSDYLEYPVNLYKHDSRSMSGLYIMDKVNGLLLKEKLQIGNKKTYNPPRNLEFLKTPEERLAFFIGFTDGDGNLTYVKNGTFKSIRIVIHGNWYEWWVEFCNQLKSDYNNLTFTVNNTNKRGNTTIYIGKKETRLFLIDFIKQYNLKILKRKWKL